MIEHPMLSNLPGIRHSFFTREGGVSKGIYDSCNVGLGSDDDREAVLANRATCMQRLNEAAPPVLATCHQIHSATVVQVGVRGFDQPPKADGMVTIEPGVALGALSADCAPLLFADPQAGVIGACHAGWRGALDGVAQATVQAMEGLGAEKHSIRAVIGPCIAQRSYQVGADYRETFVSDDPANADFFAEDPEPGKFRFDLPGFIEARLRAFGLTQVAQEGSDTLSDEDRFFSYRRTTLRGESDYGRGLSAISLE